MAGPKNKRVRIPEPLQKVFLASNRGGEVHKPPTDASASRVFLRGFFNRRPQQSGNDTSSDDETTDSTTSIPHAMVMSLPPPKSTKTTLSPQGFLDSIVSKRGYSTRRFKTLETGYYSKPTKLQRASYHLHMVQLVGNNNVKEVRAILQCGISPNPCSIYGESLVHSICRQGNYGMLEVFLEAGCSFQIADDCGRTPLHDACWATRPSFEIVKTILQHDPRLLYMTDCRGATPLSYVRRDQWVAWIDFFDDNKDVFWPQRSGGIEPPPPLANKPANSKPLPNPVDALEPDMCKVLCSGKMSPQECLLLTAQCDDEETCYDDSTMASGMTGMTGFDEDVDDLSEVDEELLDSLPIRIGA